MSVLVRVFVTGQERVCCLDRALGLWFLVLRRVELGISFRCSDGKNLQNVQGGGYRSFHFPSSILFRLLFLIRAFLSFSLEFQMWNCTCSFEV